MRTQSFFADFTLQASGQAFKEVISKRQSEEISGFSNYLKSSIDKSNSSRKQCSHQQQDNSDSGLVEFRDCTSNKKITNKEQYVGGGKYCKNVDNRQLKDVNTSGVEDDGFKDIEGKKIIDKITLESLAGVLGTDSLMLLEILDYSGINAEDLLCAEKLSDMLEKLGSFLELDAEQKDVLTTVLEEIREQVLKTSNYDEEANMGESPEKKDWVQVKNAIVDIVRQNSINNNQSMDITLKMEQIIQKLQQKINNTDSSVTSDVESESFVNNDEALATDKSESAFFNKSEGNTTAKAETSEKGSREVSNDEKSSNQATDQFGQAQAERIDEADTKPGMDASVEQNQQFEGMTNNKVFNQNRAADNVKIEENSYVSREEIINQVVDKAKVILTGDKSEMVISLKPDHLGKLSLKVVTESGIVAAEIVAENQQVKQVLESNMQLLKDSLEKQGMVVQNFSVSVRQDSQKNNFGNERRGESRMRKVGKAGSLEVTTNVSQVNNSHSRINPYEWNESSINLTA